jgi:hypothetical protein
MEKAARVQGNISITRSSLPAPQRSSLELEPPAAAGHFGSEIIYSVGTLALSIRVIE